MKHVETGVLEKVTSYTVHLKSWMYSFVKRRGIFEDPIALSHVVV